MDCKEKPLSILWIEDGREKDSQQHLVSSLWKVKDIQTGLNRSTGGMT